MAKVRLRLGVSTVTNKTTGFEVYAVLPEALKNESLPRTDNYIYDPKIDEASFTFRVSDPSAQKMFTPGTLIDVVVSKAKPEEVSG